MTPAELDLDREPQNRPGPGRGWRPATLLVALLGMLAGTWLHTTFAGTDVASTPRVSAWVGLDSVRLADTPVAVLHLEVSNHDDATVYLTGLDLSGGGVADQHQELWRPLTPGLVEDLKLTADLSCPAGTRRPPLRLTLTLTRDGAGAASPEPSTDPTPGQARTATTATTATTGTTATAVLGGLARRPDGLCQASNQQLPQAYRTPVSVRVVSASPTTLAITASGLPDDAAEIFSVRADGWFLPLAAGTVPVVRGSATLTLGPPQPSCDDTGTRSVLPTGLQLVFTTTASSGIRDAFAPVGAPLAGWLLEARRRVCPE